jgi:hypothetical protein
MTRMELPTTPGDYNVDGISIIILPNKIIVDTGNRTQQPKHQQQQGAYTHQKKSSGNGGEGKKKKAKDGDMFNSILDNCEDIVMGRKR